MTYVLYNSLSNNKTGKEAIAPLLEKLKDEKTETIDITTIFNYASFFESKQADDKFIICGGDGTINRFVNDTKDIEKHNIFHYATGSGNDFMTDIGVNKGDIVPLDDYIRNLPTVTVNGKDCLFVNGVGYGIDGYCCEVADELKKTSDKPINYSSIAIKGLLGKFKTRNAKVTVDGVTKEYSNVWLAPAMNGRYYGGGMMIAPDQSRIKNETLSVVVLHAKSKLKTLMVFPSIFKGEHVKHPEMVEILTGKEIKVEFDKPTALQIDGETVLGVTEYTAKAAVPAKV
ncbi:MAG: diacylglycerol kinase family protein [Clostridia bacterium]|nr:diacylglycerol kinase family protein [Clostridia bacterium]